MKTEEPQWPQVSMDTKVAKKIINLAALYCRNQWDPGASSQESREVLLEAARIVLDGKMMSDWHGLTTILDTLYSDVFTDERTNPRARIVAARFRAKQQAISVLARKLAKVTERAEKAETAARELWATVKLAEEALGWIAPWGLPPNELKRRDKALASAHDALAHYSEFAPDQNESG